VIHPFFPIEPTGDPLRFRMPVTSALCVGRTDHQFLFGGAGLAVAVACARHVAGRELIWATAQYLSYARPGSLLEVDVRLPVQGHNITQAVITLHCGDEVIISATAALGEREGHPSAQWFDLPQVPAPDQCQVWGPWDHEGGGTLMQRLEKRIAPGSAALRPRDGTVDPSGRMQMWLRTREDLPVDAALLALMGDFVPTGAGVSLGLDGGGNSLDNTLRLHSVVPTRWVLCDIQMSAVGRGFAHGHLRLFAEDGTLMATASQSLVLRYRKGG
jgi:acyl-CoA thioesterase